MIEKEAPLFPNYPFHENLLGGETSIVKDKMYDWWINRPTGMRGWIINLTVSGVGQIFKDEQRFLVQKGDILLFPEAVPHLYGRYENAETWCHKWIYFHPPLHWISILKYSVEIAGVFKTSITNTAEYDKLNYLFEEVAEITYTSQNDIVSNQLALNLLEQILIRCYRASQAKNERKLPNPKILEAIHWVSKNYTKPISITSIAKTIGMPPQSLTAQFKNQMGTSLMKWVNFQRLEYACRLLVIHKLPIKEVASQSGFADNLYFSRVFKNAYHITPSEYQKKFLNFTDKESGD